MRRWGDGARGLVAALERRLAVLTPTPVYQRVVLWALALGALGALLGLLFLR